MPRDWVYVSQKIYTANIVRYILQMCWCCNELFKLYFNYEETFFDGSDAVNVFCCKS